MGLLSAVPGEPPQASAAGDKGWGAARGAARLAAPPAVWPARFRAPRALSKIGLDSSSILADIVNVRAVGARKLISPLRGAPNESSVDLLWHLGPHTLPHRTIPS